MSVALIGALTNLLFRKVTDTHIIVAVVLYSVLALVLYLTILSNKINKVVDRLSNLVEAKNKEEEIIVTHEDIVRIEKEIKKSEIWVLTCDLSWDIEGEFWKIVKNGIFRRENKYVYFIPYGQNKRCGELLNRLQIDKKPEKSSVDTIYLNDEDNILFGHFVIYHPYEPDRRKAFMRSPKVEKGIAITLDAAKATELQKKLEAILNKNEARTIHFHTI